MRYNVLVLLAQACFYQCTLLRNCNHIRGTISGAVEVFAHFCSAMVEVPMKCMETMVVKIDDIFL